MPLTYLWSEFVYWWTEFFWTCRRDLHWPRNHSIADANFTGKWRGLRDGMSEIIEDWLTKHRIEAATQNLWRMPACLVITAAKTTYRLRISGGHTYEACTNEKLPQVLALLLHQIYSSYWGQMRALGILFKSGYDTLISTRGDWVTDQNVDRGISMPEQLGKPKKYSKFKVVLSIWNQLPFLKMWVRC